MAKNIVIIQGHPDPAGNHFCHALACAYAEGAKQAGHSVSEIDIAGLDFPLLRTQADFEEGQPPPDILNSQAMIRACNHLLIVYPLWHGTMPALLKGFFEQVFRYKFAMDKGDLTRMPKGNLKGKSARILVTMGMPAVIYRWYFGAHSLKSLERNILKLAGIRPIRETLIGRINVLAEDKRQKWLSKLHALGAKGF